MADYKKIAEFYPEILDFIRYRKAIRLRGDVLAYARNIDCPSFSTDGQGFRHSVVDGRKFSFVDCVRSDRYGIVLGASTTFGFGVGGNDNTMPSILAEHFGFPFANCAMPGANSRNLATFLISLLARAARVPAVVVLSTGGDLANFCDASRADPVFGSPNREQLGTSAARLRRPPDPANQLPNLLQFTSLWTSVIVSLCRGRNIQCASVHQSTFFEKTTPNRAEIESRLGEPFNDRQARQFGNFRRFDEAFFAKRHFVSRQLELPLAGWERTEDLSFVDEFHCDRSGVRRLSELVIESIPPVQAA
jgi:hypothetical protein